jgi:outer membrane protein insertion porin family
MRYILSLYILGSFFLFGQNGITVGDIDFSYSQPKEYELGPIRVIGADNFDHQAIKLIAGLSQGQKIILPGNDISNAIKNLWNEEIFSNVAIYVTKEIAGVVYLTIAVEARMKLSKFSFKGIGKRDADKLREEIKLFTGKTITENLVFQTKTKIRGYFREKGFFKAAVDISRVKDTLINASEIFIIKIEKGNKIGIKEIVISGNSEIPIWKLKMAMKDTKQKGILRIIKRSKYTESSYEKDKISLLAKFNKVGLRDASISFDTVYQLNSKNLMIEINITEGEKYYFGDIEWLGNTKYRSSFLDTVIGIKKGDLYNRNLFEQRLNGSGDGRDINSLYMDQGYLFFQVIPIEINVNQNMINYQIRIIEGKEARNGTITIKGNTKTNDYVILREIRTKPGDLFNKGDIMRTQRELAQLGYFNEQAFQVNPLPNPSKGTVDIEYIVEEKNSDQIELSGGYGGAGPTSSGRIIGTLGLTFNNFSTRNFFKKNAWSPLPGGDGQRLSMRAQSNGRFYQSYTFSFIEPWLGGKKPNSLSFSINHTALSSNGKLRTENGYAGLSISGVGIGIGKRNKWPDDYFSTYIELGYKYYDVVNDTRFPVFSKGIANDISLQYTIQRSSISAPTYPQSGSNFTFLSKATLPYSSLTSKDYSLLSPQERYKYLEYYRLKFTAEWFLPLSKDKKLILMSRFGMGYLGAYNKAKGVSPFERYSMGGSGLSGVNQIGGISILALRGYEDQSISSAGGDPIVTKYTIELRYPISLNPQATFFALAFLEGGNTFPTFDKFNPFNVKRTAGIGIRVFLPMFGMLGLDYGLGFDKLNTWSSGYGSASDISIGTKGYYPKLSFSIGMNLGEL